MILSPSGSGHREEVVDVDFIGECTATGEYAKDIFTYLREAEVSLATVKTVPLGGIVLALAKFITSCGDNFHTYSH